MDQSISKINFNVFVIFINKKSFSVDFSNPVDFPQPDGSPRSVVFH